MTNHFSTIGFHINSVEELVDLANKASAQSEAIEVKDGTYYYWHDTSGAELWIQANQDNELIGMNPHFAGQSMVKVGLTKGVEHPDHTLLDGTLHGWANPSPGKTTTGDYPFIFDLPDFAQYERLHYPSIVAAQIAAFAHEITLYDSVAAYDEELPVNNVKFLSQSFFPASFLNLMKSDSEPPSAHALFTGHILASEERVNTQTGMKFYWSLVETLGGTFDVVIHPVLVPELPKVGGVLSGTFWLSGKLIN